MRLFGRKREPPADATPRISVKELRQRLARGQDLLILDVRQPHAYTENAQGVPGSIRIPPSELPERFDELPRHGLIVPYCT